jgi:hypothetical protein
MGIFFTCTKQTYTTAAEKRLMPGKPNLETLIHKTLLPCALKYTEAGFFLAAKWAGSRCARCKRSR